MTLYLKFMVTNTRVHPKRVECFRHVSEFVYSISTTRA